MSKQNRPSLPINATMTSPLVAGVADAWLAFTCRFRRGTPWCTVRSHTIFPLCRSTAMSRQVCGPVSVAESMPDLSTSPVFTAGRPLAATAVVT
jgi:hypothetical protein